jgi:predicted RNA-binding Zn-ribbon protein involved in translation (DUF1610 family)
MQVQVEGKVRLVCRVTGKPFYPVEQDGKVYCSQCGQMIYQP